MGWIAQWDKGDISIQQYGTVHSQAYVAFPWEKAWTPLDHGYQRTKQMKEPQLLRDIRNMKAVCFLSLLVFFLSFGKNRSIFGKMKSLSASKGSCDKQWK